jgi:tRNA nucleotidyltransferase (CCA-adding enzyme)
MVGKKPQMSEPSNDTIGAALRRQHPELAELAELAEQPVFLVGGAVRDLLLGRGRSRNLDLVVEGDATAFAGRLGVEVLVHERFATATVRFRGLEVDVAAARTEAYASPGALPEVRTGASIEDDLRRRDFTVNAMAVPLREPRLLDPLGGRADLDAGLLRALHERSFVDDPTRALRAARYASRLGFSLEAATEALLRSTDLGAVSGDRREAEILRLAAEPEAVRGFELLAAWGLVELRPGGAALAAAVADLLESHPEWAAMARRDLVLRAAALGPPGAEVELAAARPTSPSQAVALATRHDPAALLLARAQGADWLDRYLEEWRHVALQIDGGDLIEAGVPEGPAVGRGLAEALRMKLDGRLAPGRAEELAAALAAAGDGDAVA